MYISHPLMMDADSDTAAAIAVVKMMMQKRDEETFSAAGKK